MKLASGKVYLVGAGPGDPGLITLKGIKLLRKADVIVYDRLVPSELLKEAAREAELVYAGKYQSSTHETQTEINRLLVRRARAGKLVVRLKGGDPTIFGRGTEEILELARERIPFEIVPGITSAIAAPAYAGIPLTHRRLSSSVAIVTGHEAKEKVRRSVDFRKLAKAVDTVVILMGVARLQPIVTELIKGGLDPRTPTSVIMNGTMIHQRVYRGQLATIAKKNPELTLKPPAVIVIGKVSSLSKRLAWFKPTQKWKPRVAITRSLDAARLVAERLRRRGLEPLVAPTIQIEDAKPKLEIILRKLDLGLFGYTIFTSTNGVRFFFKSAKRHHSLQSIVRCLSASRLVAIGPSTSNALRKMGAAKILTPVKFSSRGILDLLSAHDLKGKRILLPSSNASSPLLKQGLRSRGAEVVQVPVYHVTIPRDQSSIVELIHRILNGNVDAVTFTSPSTFRNLLHVAERLRLRAALLDGLKMTLTVCIGPTTLKALRKSGLADSRSAGVYTAEGLVEVLIETLQERGFQLNSGR